MKRITITTRPGRRGSRRCVRVRIVLQETTAKPTEIRKRIRKVRRQRSRWRFSNSSRREEIVGRVGAPDGDSFDGSGENAPCLDMSMRAAPDDQRQEAVQRVARIIVGTA